MRKLLVAALLGAAATLAAGTGAQAAGRSDITVLTDDAGTLADGVSGGTGKGTKPVSADPHLIDPMPGAGTSATGVSTGSGAPRPV